MASGKKPSSGRPGSLRHRWTTVGLLILFIGAGAIYLAVRPSAGAYAAYTDGAHPTLVFLYTDRPHTMPGGSAMT